MLKNIKRTFYKKVKWVCILAFFATCILAAPPIQVSALQGHNAGFDTMEHPELMPLWLPDGTQTKQFISSDPGHNNSDMGLRNFKRYTDANGELVYFDEKGAGCLYRQQMNVWHAGDWSNTRIKLYFDGETTARLDMPFNQFWGKGQSYITPFTQPLTFFDNLGSAWGTDNFSICYYPFAFRTGLKITLQNAPTTMDMTNWFQYTYLKYPTPSEVVTWTGTSVDSTVVRNQWNNLGTDPKDTTGNVNVTNNYSINNGSSATVLDLSGQGSIASMKFTMNTWDVDTFNSTNIKIYWDNSSTPAVDQSIGSFFGGAGDTIGKTVWNKEFKSAFYGFSNTNKEFFCYWSMPYWSRAKVVITNNSGKDITNFGVNVNYKPSSALDYNASQAGYFHSKRTLEYDNNSTYATAFTDSGKGKVMGIMMYSRNFAMDGNEYTFIDDSNSVAIEGDGTEDDHNQGYGGNAYQKPLWGGVINGFDGGYRTYYNDSYIYDKNINIIYELSNFTYGIVSGVDVDTDINVWYYKKDAGDGTSSNLILTDELDVGNTTSESNHSYSINTNTQSLTTNSYYDGIEKNKTMFPINDSGRYNKGYSQFDVAIDPGNNGVLLRKRVNRLNDNVQLADVYVNNVKVTESPWYMCVLNPSASYVFGDTNFSIPQSYTTGKSSITVKIVYQNATDTTNGINEYYYWVYSYAPVTSATSAYTDDFSSSTLGTAWSWVRADSTMSSLTNRSGFMRIACQSGDIYSTGNNAKNLLLRDAPLGDWTLVTRLEFSPTDNYQQAGLVIYQDDDNYLKLCRAFSDGQNICASKEIAGTYAQQLTAVTATSLDLKISKADTTYTMYYSTNGGTTWIQAAQYTGVNLGTSLKVGLCDFGGPTGVNADFDWFNVTSAYTDDFSSSTLGTAWSWVRADSTMSSLTNRSGFMRIACQSGDIYSTGNNAKNLLLRDAPSGDWTLMTRLEFSPTDNYQQAGLVIYQDDDNYLKLSRAFSDGQTICASKEIAGTYAQQLTAVTATSLDLKISKAGTTYTMYYSANGGTTWIQAAQYTGVNLGTSLKVGLCDFGGPTGVNADFDWFNVN